jgi:hypothetical protein
MFQKPFRDLSRSKIPFQSRAKRSTSMGRHKNRKSLRRSTSTKGFHNTRFDLPKKKVSQKSEKRRSSKKSRKEHKYIIKTSIGKRPNASSSKASMQNKVTIQQITSAEKTTDEIPRKSRHIKLPTNQRPLDAARKVPFFVQGPMQNAVKGRKTRKRNEIKTSTEKLRHTSKKRPSQSSDRKVENKFINVANKTEYLSVGKRSSLRKKSQASNKTTRSKSRKSQTVSNNQLSKSSIRSNLRKAKQEYNSKYPRKNSIQTLSAQKRANRRKAKQEYDSKYSI